VLDKIDLLEDGPPLLYQGSGHGEEQGVPPTGILRVLVALCHPSDLAPPNPATIRTNIITNFTNVLTYYDQISYGDLDVQIDVTSNWRTLDGTASELISGDNLAKGKLTQIIAEAAQQATDEGLTLNDYDLIAAMVYTNQDIRCWGGGAYSHFQYNNTTSGIAIDISTNHSLSTIWINETADWGRCTHEVGHCLIDVPGNLSAWPNAAILKEDVYRSDLVDLSAATAHQFDMMGDHDRHPLFSGYYMDQMGYYTTDNIHDLTWDRNLFSQTFDVVAHGSSENSNTSRYHLIKIKVTEGLFYYIEVRQRPSSSSPLIFDTNIPLNGSLHNGGVVVTKVFTDIVNMNQQMRFITLLHPPHVLKNGEKAIDPARFLTISVENDHVQEDPLVCRVKIEWANVIGDTPGGDFDLWIDPWNANYETPDIWIDRPPYGTYDYTDPVTNQPTGNGDKPRPLDKNRLYGRVHCDGQVDATNVFLTFYAVTPPGVGDNGNWAPLETIKIDTIGKNTTVERSIIWVPEVGEHTCLKIHAEPQAGEVFAGGNNWAQENVFYFEAPANSVPNAVTIPVAVRNPLREDTMVFISVRNVPDGFIAQFPHQWVWLKPLYEKRLELTVIPLYDYRKYREKEIRKARIKVEGFIPREYQEKLSKNNYPASCFSSIGGILSEVTPKQSVKLVIDEHKEYSHKENNILVRGNISPKITGEKVTLYLDNPKNMRSATTVVSDKNGEFFAVFDLSKEPSLESKTSRKSDSPPLPGIYVCQAFIANGNQAAYAESNILYINKK